MFLFCLCQLGLPDTAPDKAPNTNSRQLLLLGDEWNAKGGKITSSRLKPTNQCGVALSPHESFSCCFSVSKISDETTGAFVREGKKKKNHAYAFKANSRS